MKRNLIHFLRISFPFLLTVGLWRLSAPFWNPAGILAIIPIFFCSFIKPVKLFHIFSMIMCLIIDYKFGTVCFWLAMYCLFYTINCFQNIIDVTHTQKDGLFTFMSFLGVCILIQTIADFTWLNLLRGIWIVLWVTVVYVPTVISIKKVCKYD